ncbi:MAG: hypothetical protein AABY32_02150 [Nanoarchaeota archaeon]
MRQVLAIVVCLLVSTSLFAGHQSFRPSGGHQGFAPMRHGPMFAPAYRPAYQYSYRQTYRYRPYIIGGVYYYEPATVVEVIPTPVIVYTIQPDPIVVQPTPAAAVAPTTPAPTVTPVPATTPVPTVLTPTSLIVQPAPVVIQPVYLQPEPVYMRYSYYNHRNHFSFGLFF